MEIRIQNRNSCPTERECEKLCTENGKLVCSAEESEMFAKSHETFSFYFIFPYKHFREKDSEQGLAL